MTLWGVQGLYWIGAEKDIDGNWSWSDGSSWGYTKWSWGEPNNNGGWENKVVVDKEGFWRDVAEWTEFPFICQGKKMFNRGQNGLLV